MAGAPGRVIEQTVGVEDGAVGPRLHVGNEALAAHEDRLELLADGDSLSLERSRPRKLLALIELDLRQLGEIEDLWLLEVYLAAAEQKLERASETPAAWLSETAPIEIRQQVALEKLRIALHDGADSVDLGAPLRS
ncbi:MAG: hypothetical protein ACREVO_15395, partial [Steroidobacteraceae bacterium]